MGCPQELGVLCVKEPRTGRASLVAVSNRSGRLGQLPSVNVISWAGRFLICRMRLPKTAPWVNQTILTEKNIRHCTEAALCCQGSGPSSRATTLCRFWSLVLERTAFLPHRGEETDWASDHVGSSLSKPFKFSGLLKSVLNYFKILLAQNI